MRTSSRKAKGRRLQDWIRDKLKEVFGFSDDDVRSAIMGETGEDVKLSTKARKQFPFKIEAKNQEAYKKVYNDYQQCKDHTASGEALLIIKMNRQPPLAVVDAEFFIRMIKNGKTD